MYPDEGQGEPCPNGLHRAGEDYEDYLKTILLLQMANGGVRSSELLFFDFSVRGLTTFPLCPVIADNSI